MHAPYICAPCARDAGWRMPHTAFELRRMCSVCENQRAVIDSEDLGHDPDGQGGE